MHCNVVGGNNFRSKQPVDISNEIAKQLPNKRTRILSLYSPKGDIIFNMTVNLSSVLSVIINF